MSDIFREVDEEVRRSQAEALWKRYGNLIIGLCVLVVIGVGGYRYFEWQKENAAAAAGAEFEAAISMLQGGKTVEGEAAIAKIAASGSGAYRTLAQFRAASDQAKKDPPGALKTFDALASDQTIEAAFRDMARLRAGMIAVDLEGFADVERRLLPLVSNNGSFRHQAHELMAASAVKAREMDKAQRYLDAIIIDRQAPADLRGRAEVLIGVTRGAK
ncbi:MAG: tetratricopeptide repeat protein [Beijerinckiaceae bacterium]